MGSLLGKITASLIENDQSLPGDLVKKINDNIKPPESVSAENVHIYAMYIISDQRNSFGGRFPADEHERLAELLIDCPVLVGHRKDSLPIARNFHAEMMQKGETNWIKVYFYWLRNSEKGDDLKKNIDGGIYKECSISFIFNFPECSICGSDIRQCRHKPFTEYDTNDGEKKEAYFNYRQIMKVLETSLVYRGSVSDTSLTNELSFFKKTDSNNVDKKRATNEFSLRRIWDLNHLDRHKMYYVMPAYESLRVNLDRSDNGIKLLDHNNRELNSHILSKCLSGFALPDGSYSLDCRLIGYRGKERRPVSELIEYIKGNGSSVRRIELKISDLIRYEDNFLAEMNGSARRAKLGELFNKDTDRLIPVEMVPGGEIMSALKRAATRYGIEILDCDSSDRFLFTHRKLASFAISSRDKVHQGFKYGLIGLSGSARLPVSGAITSEYDLRDDDVIEIEVYSINDGSGMIELVQPRIVDWYGHFHKADDLADLFEKDLQTLPSGTYTVFESNGNRAVLMLAEENSVSSFVLYNYSPKLLEKGRKLLADRTNTSSRTLGNPLGSGSITGKTVTGDSIIYNFDGSLNGKFIIRPVILNKARRFLFCRLAGITSSE